MFTDGKGKEIIMEQTKVYLNTWGAYNDGCIGYGWMTPDEAEEFISENEERDGGEWFIADIDNYLGVDFGNLNYANVNEVIDTIRTLEDMNEYERKVVIAIMEVDCCDVDEAMRKAKDYCVYESKEDYFDSLDGCLCFPKGSEFYERYFDFDRYHEDSMDCVTEASNGVIIVW